MKSENKEVNTERRKALKLIGAGGVALLTGDALANAGSASGSRAAAPKVCLVSPRQMEGPYFVDQKLHRTDIRSDPTDGNIVAGVPLLLTLNVSEVSSGGQCKPLPKAVVDIWHCDANGLYSDVEDPDFNTRGKQFLRGYQVCDENGSVSFTTIYPGWYPGRAVHIHFKVRTQAQNGQIQDFTSQLYFDDKITDQVYLAAPYNRRGERYPRNNRDWIYRRGKGELLQVTPVMTKDQSYTASLDIGVSQT